MSQQFYIELAARCDAAGRPDNEDNFQVAEDLSVSNVGFTSRKQIPLGPKGTLLLVCDGMGGMNAGEVASDIAVETIKQRFSKENLTDEVLSSDESISQFIRNAIIQADKNIKTESVRDREKSGMGSTVVLVWLLGNSAYVGWCGDSRAYRYRPSEGLTRLSHDHSYVQELADSGELLPELAFDHPNKNIITRSLGDMRKTANPDIRIYDVEDGDIFLLCSDGLHDALRDNEIEQCIKSNQNDMVDCLDSLWETSKEAGWMDNVTVELAKASLTLKAKVPAEQPKPQPVDVADVTTTVKAPWKKYAVFIITGLLLIIVGFCLGRKSPRSYPDDATLDKAADEYFQKPSDKRDKNDWIIFLDTFKKWAKNPEVKEETINQKYGVYVEHLKIDSEGTKINELKKAKENIKKTSPQK